MPTFEEGFPERVQSTLVLSLHFLSPTIKCPSSARIDHLLQEVRKKHISSLGLDKETLSLMKVSRNR